MVSELFKFSYKIEITRDVTTYYDCKLLVPIGEFKEGSDVSEIDIYFKKGEIWLTNNDGETYVKSALVYKLKENSDGE